MAERGRGNPDVEEQRYNRDGCKHPEDKLFDGWAPAGTVGLIGCHNVSVVRCRDCGQVVDMGTLAHHRAVGELAGRIARKARP